MCIVFYFTKKIQRTFLFLSFQICNCTWKTPDALNIGEVLGQQDNDIDNWKKKIVWCNDKWIYENIWKSQKLASTVKFCVVQGFIYNYIVEPHYSLILILSSGSNSIWIQEQGDIWPKWIQIFLPDLKVSYLWGSFYSLYQSAVCFWLLLCTIQFYRYFKILGTQIHTPYKIHV